MIQTGVAEKMFLYQRLQFNEAVQKFYSLYKYDVIWRFFLMHVFLNEPDFKERNTKAPVTPERTIF